jgi:endonuclease/exonuclease/phosphatase (EEP) superfamily protein YafD
VSDLQWLRPILIGLGMIPIVGTVLSFSRRTHWPFRMWDFPRMQIAAAAAATALAYAVFFSRWTWGEIALIVASVAVVAFQLYRVHAYTPIARSTVKRARHNDPANRITLLISNVLQDNRQYERLLEAVRREDPDVVLAMEVDQPWVDALEPLAKGYPQVVRCPLDNYYGMVLFSRLDLIDPELQFLVQDDIPSIHAGIKLRSGAVISFHGIHPRPPEPIHNQPSSPRDAELVVVGRAIGKEKGKVPTIVAGDLNDVAWSDTSELFVRLSGLLDPRAGRGFYNTFNAKNPVLRWALDHIFHSIHFELVRMRRLPSIGSDHFPILIELQYDPRAAREQEPSHRKEGDEETADEKLAQEAHDAATGDDRPRGE